MQIADGKAARAQSPEHSSEEETRFEHNVYPRWLPFSGLPQVLGPTLWAVFWTIVQLDHQSEGMQSRRHGKGNRTFAWPLADIAIMTGLDVRTVGRAAAQLKRMGLLEKYEPGKSRSWSHFQVNRQVLLELCLYVAPMLRKVHGGIQNAKQGDRSLEPKRIYNVGNGFVEPVMLDAIAILKLWKARTEEPERPDPERVRAICHLD